MLLIPKSLWGDEWFSIELAAQPLMSVVIGAIHDVHPPGYFLLLAASIRALGQNEIAFRLVSFLASIGTVWMVYHIGNRLGAKACGWVAALLVAISPYWLQSSNEIRSYSLLAFLSCAGVYGFIRCLEAPLRNKYLALYAAGAISAVYTEHYAWFWVFSSAFFSFFAPKEVRKKLVLSSAAILMVCLPSLLLIGYQALHTEEMFKTSRVAEYLAPALLFKKAVGVFWHFVCGYRFSMLTLERISYYIKESALFWASAAATLLAGILVLKGLHSLLKQRALLFWYFLAAAVAPAVFLLIVYPIRLEARYLSFAAPIYFLLIAQGIVNLRSKRWVYVSTGLLLLVALSGSVYTITLPTDAVHKEEYRDQVRHILEHAGPEDAICGLEPQVRYYSRSMGITPRSRVFASLEALAKEQPGRYHKVWIPNSVNMHPEVSERIYQEKVRDMQPLGYRPAGSPLKFGGEEGLNVLYVFEAVQ